VCSRASTMEFQLSALWIKSCCGGGTWTVREPRNENVRCWKPVPGGWWRTADWEDSLCAIVKFRLCELLIAPEWIAIKNCKSPINPVNNPHTMSTVTHYHQVMTICSSQLLPSTNGFCTYAWICTHPTELSKSLLWSYQHRWLRCYATSWKVTGSDPDEVNVFSFHLPNPSSCTMALGCQAWPVHKADSLPYRHSWPITRIALFFLHIHFSGLSKTPYIHLQSCLRDQQQLTVLVCTSSNQQWNNLHKVHAPHILLSYCLTANVAFIKHCVLHTLSHLESTPSDDAHFASLYTNTVYVYSETTKRK
jgi:hypothetical protein